ncbi:hypothetical protein [Lacibacter sp. H407]|uniref:hypothetical protein n=1 Tax=Lacibacter sp. H407 TaxID=3133423 RepID=UPI0030C53B7C
MSIFTGFKVRVVGDINPFNNLLFPFILSFFGLFFALQAQTCNQKKNDRKKESQYLSSLKSDLTHDISRIDSILQLISTTTLGLDTALEQMQKPMDKALNIKLNYILIMKYDWFPPVVNFNEGTITQLKSTGGLTLIDNPDLLDSIGVYQIGLNLCHKDANMVIDAYKETFSTQKFVYNYRDRLAFQDNIGVSNSYELQNFSNDTLLAYMDNRIKMVTDNKEKIIACYNDFAAYKASLELYYETILRQREITINLITFISKKK